MAPLTMESSRLTTDTGAMIQTIEEMEMAVASLAQVSWATEGNIEYIYCRNSCKKSWIRKYFSVDVEMYNI